MRREADRARARVTCTCTYTIRAAAFLLAACTHPHAPPAATPGPGASIAIYADHAGHGIAVVDDRRWIDVAGDRLVIDDLGPGVALPSLVLETLSGPGALAIGSCGRDRMVAAEPPAAPDDMPSGLGDNPVPPPPALRASRVPDRIRGGRRLEEVDGKIVVREPMRPGVTAPELALAPSVHCAVTGAPGRYLVRLLYSSTALAYHADHEVTVATPDRAHVASEVSISTPPWRARSGEPVAALVTAYDGMPGGDAPPSELARGRLVLDGSVGVLPLPARDVPARVRRVITPSEDVSAADVAPSEWIQQRRTGNADEPDALVWATLELPGTHLAPGSLHVRVEYPGEEPHERVVTAENRAQGDEAEAGLRLPLWADDELRASIQRAFGGRSETELIEKFGATVINIGPTPREVFVEEKLRPGGKRTVTNAWPGKPGLAGDTLRMKLDVAPGKVERVGFVVTYRY